jgi:aromatic ring-opening dioxygenase LigB subunit
MTTPIIMSDKLHLSSNYLQQIQHKETLIRPEFKNVELNKENDAFSPQNIRFSNQISIINKQEINDIYNKIKIEVKNKLDKSNTSHAELTTSKHLIMYGLLTPNNLSL